MNQQDEDFGKDLAKARDKWFVENRGITDAASLGTGTPDRYLKNRLERAFIDGATWANERKGKV